MLTIPWKIHTLNWTKSRVPIPRSKLVYEIARKVDRYLTRMTVCLVFVWFCSAVAHKRMQGTTLDGSVEECWRIGQGFMHIENMYLVSLMSVSKGSFQPDIWVEIPSVSRARTGEGSG